MVKGANNNIRNMAVDEVISFLNEIPGVSDLEHDNKAGKDEIAVRPNDALLSRYGLTVSDISQTIRTMYGGKVATTTRYGDEDVDFSEFFDCVGGFEVLRVDEFVFVAGIAVELFFDLVGWPVAVVDYHAMFEGGLFAGL